MMCIKDSVHCMQLLDHLHMVLRALEWKRTSSTRRSEAGMWFSFVCQPAEQQLVNVFVKKEVLFRGMKISRNKDRSQEI